MDPTALVSSIMTTDIVSASVSLRPSKVRRMLLDNGVHHLPVVRGEELVGLVSSADMYKLSMASYGADERAVDAFLDHQFSLEDIMKTKLVTIAAGESIRKAAEILSDGSFHSLPVVDPSGQLVGMLTSTDLIRYLLEQFESAA